ncbi:MAG: Chitin synthase, class 7 [Bathelium mastoideum]|nr:MAG: Chitin synthase, class 7 [Bathelium mastoideum]
MGFGDFETICQDTALSLCVLVGPPSSLSGATGIQATCYARPIELANTIIFEGAASFIHIIALIMTVIMIIHVRSKFTAVGRKEITTFFYLYMLLTVCSLILDSGVIPPGGGAFPYFAALQAALTSSLCVCLMINGFVGFQLYEDGTTLSVWLLRLSSLAAFIITGAVALLTFKDWAGLGPTNTTGLFVVLYVFNAVFLFVYVVMQVLLVSNTLQDRWPLGDICFGVFFFVVGQVILYVASDTICENTQHYVDGLFIATVCNLLAVMMVYKYWDSITREDLEFSVGTKQNNWEVKELLPEDERRNTVYQDSEYASSAYFQAERNSKYGSHY